MTPIFKKLNYKSQPIIYVLNAPNSFDGEISEISRVSKVKQNLSSDDEIDFCVIFFTKKAEIKEAMEVMNSIWKGDAIFWFCYPKSTSKLYKCDFNRDNGWDEISKYDVEPVRQVSIDLDWSALRFRKTKYIKTMTRSQSFALSASGKEKTSGN